jgi:uncharacterized membrane protein
MSKNKKKDSFIKQYLRAFRFYLLTGLIVWTPLLVTVWLTWWLFTKVGGNIENLIENIYAWLNGLAVKYDRLGFLAALEYRKGYGFLIAIALFLTTGFIARNIIGMRIIRSIERMFSRVPGINRIYKAVGQIRDVVVGRQGAVFQKVCVIEYPRQGVHVVAFVTSKERGIVQESLDKELVAVFVPTTPNPTSGFLLYLKPEDVREIELEVEEAMKLIISGGAYIPGKDEEELLHDSLL